MSDQRETLISLAKRISERRLTISTGGNVSTRLPDGNILITPSKHHKSFSELDVDDLSVVDLKGRLVEGPKPSAEVPMHVAIHSIVSDTVWVVHAHPPLAVAFASERKLPVESFVETTRLKMSLVGVESPGSQELADAVAEKIKLGNNAVLLEGHGVVVVSNDSNDVFLLLDELENACKTDLARKLLRLSKVR